MREIDDIIRATKTAYIRFAAAHPDKETREMVRNAVLFLAADLTSASEYATSKERQAACR